MPAGAIMWTSAEVSRHLTLTRVDDAHRYSLACAPNRELQVTVVRYHDRRVNLTIQDIKEGKGELADHLVKLPSRDYDNLIENEYSMMYRASKIGIEVPDCEIRMAGELGPLPRGFDPLEEARIYVVRRFDRGPYDSIEGDRIHMEDLNQVVDNKPRHKYRHVSFERLGRIILELCGESDFLEYVRRLTFCIGIGNEDAHLKNLTIWYPDRIQPRLALAYDLVSTIRYPGLDRKMAFQLGQTRNSSRVTPDTMMRLGDRTGVDPVRVAQTVRQTLESMRDSWVGIRRDLPVGRSFRNRLRDYQRSVPLLRPFVIWPKYFRRFVPPTQGKLRWAYQAPGFTSRMRVWAVSQEADTRSPIRKADSSSWDMRWLASRSRPGTPR